MGMYLLSRKRRELGLVLTQFWTGRSWDELQSKAKRYKTKVIATTAMKRISSSGREDEQAIAVWEDKTMTRIAEDLAYNNTMTIDTDKPCVKCKYYKDDDGMTVCIAQKPPFYRGDYRIRNCDTDSCNSWEQVK
jgi:hypothetical protein